jgi:capsular exopolysaccharide synthesis family protein
MGRLNKALERIKNDETARHGLSRGTKGVRPNFAPPESASDPINDRIQKVRLDPAILYENHVITDDIEPVVQTSYKMLRTRTLQRLRTNSWRTLAVTSATQGDGKSLTAINLAMSLAGDVNYNVCLVDLDLRHSSVANYLGLTPKFGVSDCLQNNVPIEKVLIRTDIDRFVVLPNVRTVTNSSELISSPSMYDLAARLMTDPNRIIIYDMPPLLAADDMLAFERIPDAILLVTAEGKTRRTDTLKACELLENSNVIGTVLNHSDEKTAAYY